MSNIEEQINFHLEEVSLNLPPQAQLCAWIYQALSQEGQTLEEINFIFCSDEYLYQMNKQYLNHDDYTDIITFPYQTEGEPVQGDIFISVDRVADNAKDLELSFEEELRRVMIHGVLHLMGYLDKTPEDKAQMTAKEDFYLKTWL